MKKYTNKNIPAFSRRLRDLFTLTGLREELLARRACVSVETVRRWQSGAALPDVEQIKVIADFFTRPCAWFIDGTDGMPDTACIAALTGLSEDTIELLEDIADEESEEFLDAMDDAVYAVVEAMLSAREATE